jgi:hypothetical protein
VRPLALYRDVAGYLPTSALLNVAELSELPATLLIGLKASEPKGL